MIIESNRYYYSLIYRAQNNIILFSNPVLLEVAVDFFYGEAGIAQLEPSIFRKRVPLPGLVLVRFYVSMSTHIFQSVTHGERRRRWY